MTPRSDTRCIALADLAALVLAQHLPQRSPAPLRSDRPRMVWSCPTKGVLPAPRTCKDDGRRLPGGEPPVAYRSANGWARGNSFAREPYSSRGIRVEIMADRRNMDAR